MKKPVCFDNGGKTYDRYTIIIDENLYVTASRQQGPLGFFQHCCGQSCVSNLRGKRIPYDSLPEQVRKTFESIYNQK